MRADLPDLRVIEHGVVAARDGGIIVAGVQTFRRLPMGLNGSIARRWITPGLGGLSYPSGIWRKLYTQVSNCGLREQAIAKNDDTSGDCGAAKGVAYNQGAPSFLPELDEFDHETRVAPGKQ